MASFGSCTLLPGAPPPTEYAKGQQVDVFQEEDDLWVPGKVTRVLKNGPITAKTSSKEKDW